jgi:hypothetical protein
MDIIFLGPLFQEFFLAIVMTLSSLLGFGVGVG